MFAALRLREIGEEILDNQGPIRLGLRRHLGEQLASRASYWLVVQYHAQERGMHLD